ncbi:MAG: T9SS type A sorting domain-containing protein [Lentimicrobiaceae bacterium]|nr:T9SS type A sorting domain-containing protein [Lentimicrobiaceae bacterium]
MIRYLNHPSVVKFLLGHLLVRHLLQSILIKAKQLRPQLMRILYLFFMICFSFSSAHSQNGFTTIYGDHDVNLPLSVKEIGENYYIATASCDGPFTPDNKASIAKMNKFGEIVSEKLFITGARQYYPIKKIYPLNETEFLLLGSYRENDTSNSAIWVLKMDTLLNVLWEKKIPVEKKYVERICYTINDSGNIVMGVTICTDPPNFNFSILFLEITMEGNVVRIRNEATGSPSYSMIYSLIRKSDGYYAFADGFASYMPIPITSPTQRLDLDDDFNIVNVHTLPMGIDLYMTAHKLNEQTYLLIGVVYIVGSYHDIGIQKTDTSNTVLASNHSGVPGEFPDYPAWFESMALNDKNNIYTGGTGYVGMSFTQCNLTYPQVFLLSNYDSLLNCRWTRYYGSDTACYYMMTMDATDDGGCIMAGTILSPNSNPNQTDVIIIKVDSEGLITSSNKQDTRVMQAMVYPNPGNDYLFVQTGPQNIGANFMLIDIAGQKLLEQIVNEATQQIPTNTLPPGTYFWTLNKGNMLIESGKWIKQ